jgi:hypothetical protein
VYSCVEGDYFIRQLSVATFCRRVHTTSVVQTRGGWRKDVISAVRRNTAPFHHYQGPATAARSGAFHSADLRNVKFLCHTAVPSCCYVNWYWGNPRALVDGP